MKGRTNFLGLRSHFVKASTKIFDLGLPTTAIAVFFYIVSLTEDFDPSVRWISNKMGISKSTAANALNDLRAANVIILVKDNTLLSSAEYRFNAPNNWRHI